MKLTSIRCRVSVFLAVMFGASILLTSCFTTVQAFRKKTFMITTNPPGAEVSTAEGSSRKVIGTTPVEYESEVPVLKKHFPGENWAWLLAPVAVTGVGHAILWSNFNIDKPWSGAESVGAVFGFIVGPLSFGTLLVWFLASEISAASDDGTELAGSSEILSFAKDGYEDSSVRLESGPGINELKLDLRPAWYTRFGMKSAKDLEASEVVPLLKLSLTDSNPTVRAMAAEKLGGFGVSGFAAMPDLETLIGDKDPAVSQAALQALEKLKFADRSRPRCGLDSCHNHGACDDSSGTIVCTCLKEYLGYRCQQYAAGHRDYGDGIAKPSDPCQGGKTFLAEHRVCENQKGTAVRGGCWAGYHEEGEDRRCVEDVRTCPEGTELEGSAPPQGYEQWCAQRDAKGRLVRHGFYRSWFEGNKLSSEGEYREGLKQGKWIFYYADGGKRLEAEYQNDKKTGLWIFWSQDGTKQREVEYRDDIEVPAEGHSPTVVQKKPAPELVPVIPTTPPPPAPTAPMAPTAPTAPAAIPPMPNCPESTQVRGSGPSQGFEQYCARQDEKGGWVKHGWYRSWFESKRLSSEGEYREGLKQGKWILYYKNGSKRLEAEFENDKKNGVWIFWSQDGAKEREVQYMDNVEVKPGEKCGPDSCQNHGACDDSSGTIVCTCEKEYLGDRCQKCTAGYRDYGDGTCKPSNPCEAGTAFLAEHRVCENRNGAAVRGGCWAGYHEEGEDRRCIMGILTCPGGGSEVIGSVPQKGHEKWCAKRGANGSLIKHGWYRSWFESDRLSSEGEYREGLKEGKWIFYYPDGKKRLEAEYKNDKKTGLWTTWSQDGRSATTVEYRDDVEVPPAR